MHGIMGGKEISVKKYVVKLSGEKREQLEVLIRKGRGSARQTQAPVPFSMNESRD
jgi:hypothetical protein